MQKPFAHILNKLWYVAASVIILAALLVSISRLLTPVLNEHRTDFEKIASNILNMPVMIHEVAVSWHGYEPEISLTGVTVLDPETQKPKIAMQRFDVDFNIWRSIWTRKPFIQNITLSGVELVINHSESGELQIGDLTKLNIKDTFTGAPVQSDAMFEWVFSQPRLALENIQLHYIGPKAAHSVTLKKLTLQNTSTHHILDGEAILNQELPTQVDVYLSWDGDVRKLMEAKAHLYLHFEGLSLPQWFSKQVWHGFHVTQGVANTKIWIHWDHNQINRVQSEFDIYDLTLFSTIEKRIELINRVSAVGGWKRDGDTQTWVGDKVLLDFPDHYWPASNFSLKATQRADGTLALNNIQSSYLNIGDLARIVLEMDFLSALQRQTLSDLTPQGEIADLQTTLPADLTDIKHLALSGKGKNLAVSAYQQYPGFTHLSGAISWNGTTANVNLASKDFSLTANQLFAQTLYFNALSANFDISTNAQGDWVVGTPNLHIDTVDALADLKFVTTVPKGRSPKIDLAANFKVMNAAHITNYLPVKAFDPDLTAWLQAAFLSGQFVAGKAVISGALKDFPFDANPSTGKFLVSMGIKDMELNYARGWPHLRDLKGQLTFAGSAMTVDASSGQILNAPVSEVHAVLPYIGPNGPQILQVNSTVRGDLTEALDFIQQSPLQKTIGKDLAAMRLTGPMQLELALVVPLGKPSNTTVKGDVTVNRAKLVLPAWNLSLDQLHGALSFTEQGIEAKNIVGELFGEEASLQMTTLHDAGKTGQMRADLSSKIRVPVLQKWLGINLSNVATGMTPFQLQLYLSPHDAQSSSDRVVVSSTLQGVALNLPRPYAKTAEPATDFRVTVDLSDGAGIKTELAYAKLINAALKFEKNQQGFQLFGGEIHLGGEKAAWQSAAGILVTGNLTELTVSDWQDYFASLQKSNKPGQQFDLKVLRGINLHVGMIDVMRTQLHQANVAAVPKNDAWQITLDSTEVNGNVTLPFKLSGQTVEGHFKYLHVDSAATPATTKQTGQRIDPRSLPAMSLDIDDVRYKDMKFGHVYLQLEPDRSGLRIKQLRIDEPSLQLNAMGEWTQTNKKYNTHLQGEMNAPRIGDVLTQWGFNSSNLVGSTGNVKFDLNWPDAPYLPSVSTMAGTLSLKLGEGRIVHLSESTNSKMGLGRMLNVLSLSTIPRRLSLNFSDLFEQGYSFDNMNGEFSFKGGSVYVDSMRFEGPVAGVHLKGRIGIVAKDFNIQLGVTPHVTGSLPIVATIAGGPIAGVATWLVDRVISHEVSQSLTYEYSVTGPWDNPVWKTLNQNGTYATH